MAYRFEFDGANKILLMRFHGRLTDESLTEIYWAIRKHSTDIEARAGIFDCSSVTELAASPEFLQDLVVNQGPAMGDPTRRPRFLVIPARFGLSVSRLIEISQGPKNPLFKIVLSLDEALAALGVQSPRLEPLE